MVKQVYFIRHAKSSWEYPNLADIDRPLNKRGKRDAPFMAEKLAQTAPEVDLILSSPAQRAKDTAAEFLSRMNVKEYKELKQIYHAWTDTLIEIINSLDDEINSVLVFGHNPGFTYLFNHFSDEYLDNLPTCGIFGLLCSSSWSDLDTTNTTVNLLLYPKMFKS